MAVFGLIGRQGRLAAAAMMAGGLLWTQPLRPLVVCGTSMEPAYPNHTIVWTVPRAGSVRRGDVVVLSTDKGPIIKRVAYIGGDSVPELEVAGVWQYAGDYGKPRTGHYWHVGIRHVSVPVGKVYVLGDNSYNSLDSRQLGMFDVSQIRRVVLSGRPRVPTRWDRLYARTAHATTW